MRSIPPSLLLLPALLAPLSPLSLSVPAAHALAQTPPRQVSSQPHVASLEEVTSAVTAILDQVKSDPAFAAGPQLKSAEFDYQTVITTTAAGGVGILGILTLGAARERNTTSETDFTYTVPAASPAPSTFNPNFAGGWSGRIKDFFGKHDNTQILAAANDVLPAAIKAAALSMQTVPRLTNPTGEDLSQRSFTITLAFAVKDDFNAAADLPSLVVVSPLLKFDHGDATVQTLKLTFEDRPAPSPRARPARVR